MWVFVLAKVFPIIVITLNGIIISTLWKLHSKLSHKILFKCFQPIRSVHANNNQVKVRRFSWPRELLSAKAFQLSKMQYQKNTQSKCLLQKWPSHTYPSILIWLLEAWLLSVAQILWDFPILSNFFCQITCWLASLVSIVCNIYLVSVDHKICF